jgi:hypothetical protein
MVAQGKQVRKEIEGKMALTVAREQRVLLEHKVKMDLQANREHRVLRVVKGHRVLLEVKV